MVKTYVIQLSVFSDDRVFQAALETISPYRRQKIARQKNRKDKERGLGASIALDAALKPYGLREGRMEYELGRWGKPYFRKDVGLYFSLSHAGGYAICSIGPREIGNDIELVRSERERIAARFFAPGETDWIWEEKTAAGRDERMFRIWTMKESFLKAAGCGLSLPMKDFTIFVEKDGISVEQSWDGKRYHMKEYCLPDVFCEQNVYKIAVCSEDAEFSGEPEVVSEFRSFC